MIKKPPKVLNEFFSNVVTSLNIPQFNQNDRASENISDPVIKAIVYYRGHLSVIAVKENCSSKSNFNFSFAKKVDILKEIKIFQSNKQCRSSRGRGYIYLPPPIKAIVYYRGHLSVIAVKENCSSKSNFNFSFVEKVDILKEIKILKSNKQCCSCGGRGGHLLPPPLSIPIKAIVYYRGHLSVIAVANLQLKAADLLKNA